ncbi:hypothetical protein, partial [Phascolarctobacterium sp.]|uniref:hypothetical protein n=1 Tax=Phascolarctobacterium sp. TaxID=2049039 RepID=UPI003F7FADFE
TILAFVLLPYRVDLYIIPSCSVIVNTFFVTFLTFFRDTRGLVGKRSIMYTSFDQGKFFVKNLQKTAGFMLAAAVSPLISVFL